MLKNLHLKNWRSLRDVSIDFTPITVFIGANSSGKTNIIDALSFIRDSHSKGIQDNEREGIMQAVYSRGGGEKIRTVGTNIDQSVVVEFSSKFDDYNIIKDRFEMYFSENRFQFHVKHQLSEGDEILQDEPLMKLPLEDIVIDFNPPYNFNHAKKVSDKLLSFITTRWQLLDENFMPPLVASSTTKSDVYMIDPCADNLVFMLDFMQNINRPLYDELMDDFRYLLNHVQQVDAIRDERETRIHLNEISHPDKEAPTISAGTARILAVLTAVYALDMRSPHMPGLIVIEEPETSLNPSLLKNFVEMLRGYTQDKKRQFILTTHNPAFLNYFQPEEVRVVSRDENGDTIVNPIPEYIKDIWLNGNQDEAYQLGDVWLTNAFGGVVE